MASVHFALFLIVEVGKGMQVHLTVNLKMRHWIRFILIAL